MEDPAQAEGSRPEASLEGVLALLGDRWTLRVVAALIDGPLTFGDLRRQLPGVAANVLSERLRRLERAGVVDREPYSVRPPRSRYRLLPRGMDLRRPILLLAAWGGGHSGWPEHAACGGVVEPSWYCRRCAREVDDSELVEPHALYA